jgi:hypothetical protein
MEEEKSDIDLNEDIKKIKEDYAKAKEIIKNIKDFEVKVDEFKVLLENSRKNTEESVQNININTEEIKKVKDDVQKSVAEMSDNLEKIKINIEAINNSYADFTEIKGKISGKNGEIETLLETAKSLKADIERAKNDAQVNLDKINQYLDSFSEKNQKMQSAYEDFLIIKDRIDDENNGLKPVFEFVQTIKEKSQELHKAISSFREEGLSVLTKIRKDEEEVSEIKSKIEENFNYSQEKKSEIETATGLIIDTGFSEKFERRKREIEKNLTGIFSWKNIFFYSVIILAGTLIFLFSGIFAPNDKDLVSLIRRLLITSPIMLLIGFASNQYSKERDLAEKYAFKASASAAIRSHVDYLKTVDHDSIEFKKFVIGAFNTIYKEPYDSDKQKTKIKYLEKRINELTNKKDNNLNMQEILSNSKELKELFPEDSMLDKVLSFFISITKNK